MAEDIRGAGARHVAEVRSINRELTEQALHMRCVGYLSHVKAQLLTETIFEVDEGKKHLRAMMRELANQRKVVAAENAALEQANLRWREAERVKSTFLATMSHELRTPLNAIIGFTGILQKGITGPVNEEQKKQLGMVRDNARHLLEVINDVLDISRIEAARLTTVREEFDACEAIARVMDLLRPLAEEKSLRLATRVPPKGCVLVSDRRRFEQILFNLTGNAIKFTAEGSVTVAAEARRDSDGGRTLHVSVTDTGVGIAEENMDALFKMFRQLDTGPSRPEGTGLGLAISKRLVEALGGVLSAESRPGSGSTFAFTLPLGERPRAEQER